jgi:hypothetical protein
VPKFENLEPLPEFNFTYGNTIRNVASSHEYKFDTQIINKVREKEDKKSSLK